MRAAALDIGTNSTRLLIADVVAGEVVEVARRAIVTGLGTGVDRSGVLADEPVAGTLEVLAGYAAAIEDAGTERVRAVATSAVRDAGNSGWFLDRAEAALGFRPDILDGTAEARLGFLGATLGIGRPAPYLVIDPGGGSTEFVYGSGSPESVHSVDIGSVRLNERALPDRPAGPAAVLAAAGMAAAVFEAVVLPGTPATVIGTGGTFTSLAAVALGLSSYDRNRVHGSVMASTDLGRLVDRLAAMTLDETARIAALDPARAPVILAGAVVAEAALRRSGCAEAVVSESDLLDGVVFGLAG